MRTFKRRFILLTCSIFLSTITYSQSFTIDVPKVVAMGETFRVVFTADAEPTSFTPPNLNTFDVLAGPTSSTMSSTQIINGKRTQSFQVSYTYILQAKAIGKFAIYSASAVINGKSYSTPSVTIEVVKGEDVAKTSSEKDSKTSATISGNDIFIKMSLSKSRVVKGEHLIATLKLYTKVPISGFENVKFPTFNGFWSQEVDTPQNIDFQRETVDGKIYNTALIRKYMLIPQQTGAISIEPTEMICQVQVKSKEQSRSMFDDFFESYQTVRKRLTAPGMRIQVDPLPSNAPQSFAGGVGSFSMSVNISKDSIKANEAVSLFVTISGTGNINLMETPKFTLPAEFESYDVKISDNSKNSGSGISGSKQFEFPFIPRNQGRYTLPKVEYTYYDVAKKKYVTLTSQDIVLRVGKDTGGSSNSVGIPLAVNKQAVRSLGDDIRYIKIGASSLSKGNQFFFGSITFFIILLIIIISYLFINSVLKKKIAMNKDVAGVKNRRAMKVAKAKLKNAETLLKQHLYSGFYEELHRAILGYCSDKLSLSLADLSRDKIKETLVSKAIKIQTIDELLSLIEACEYARYAPDPGNGEMDKNYERAISLISDLEG